MEKIITTLTIDNRAHITVSDVDGVVLIVVRPMPDTEVFEHGSRNRAGTPRCVDVRLRKKQ